MGNRAAAGTRHYWYKAFLLGMLLSAAFFIPYIVIGHGYFLYYGDFNVQQVPFYQMVHDAIRNGEWQWSNTTDLGSQVIGSYTFYLLGSPFFWLTLPFPSKMLPHLMGPLLILKFSCASLTGYIYLRRYVRDKNFAVIGGLLYAFSGFSVYNVFFNHFHEAIITFPLLLAAIDEYMINKRRGVVALAVFASCLVNYYFFVGMVAFVIIYWFVRMFDGSYDLKGSDFLPLAFEVVVGFAATGVLIVPTVLYVTQNPRINDFPQGYGALVYGSEQRYLHILSSLFFPPDIPARPNFTPDSNSKWASIAAWLPLFGMTGVIAFLQSKSKSWLKRLLPFLLICAFVPILNAIFQMFIMSYYARWFYMLTLMMALATIKALENTRTKWQPAIRLSLVITTAITILIGLLPNGNTDEDAELWDTIGLEDYDDRFWVYCAIALFSIAAVTLLIRTLRIDRKKFYIKATCILSVTAVIYSGYLIGLGKSHSYNVDEFIIPYALNNGDELTIDRDELKTVRSDFYESMDNMGMFWQIPTIQAFQSIVPGSIYEFYPSVGVTRDVGSRPEVDYYGLRSLLSVKYLFDCVVDDDDDFKNDEGKTRMPGYKYIDTENGFDVYENRYYIPYGFWYNNYVTEDEYYYLDENKRHLLLLKAMVLTEEQAEKYSGIMNHMTDYETAEYSSKKYKSDCRILKAHTATEFSYGKNSFHAKITVPSHEGEKLVFFSIPYEKGWSATVNGVPAEIEKVNIGFMAVKVKPEIENDIVFTYRTPGLYEGAAVTAVSILLYIAYVIISKKKNKLKPRIKLRKSYKVAAVGPQDELGERYKHLKVGTNPMKKRKTEQQAQEIENAERFAETENDENGSSETQDDASESTDTNLGNDNSDKTE